MKLPEFIDRLRETDKAMSSIFTQGGCYQFYLFLKYLYPEIQGYIKDENHVIMKYRLKFYDITGEINANNSRPLCEADKETLSRWSFSRTHFLSIGECPHCDEPLLINY